MSINPLGHLGLPAVLRGSPSVAAQIYRAKGASFIDPVGLTTQGRVSPPMQVGPCKHGVSITAHDDALGSGAWVTRLVMTGQKLGRLTFSAMTGAAVPAGASLPQVKATSIEAAALAFPFPYLLRMVNVADDMIEDQHSAHELAPSLQARNQGGQADALERRAWSPLGRGPAVGLDLSPRRIGLRGNPIMWCVNNAKQGAGTRVIQALINGHRIITG